MAHFVGALGDSFTGLADIAGYGPTAATGAALYGLYRSYRGTSDNSQVATSRTLRRIDQKMARLSRKKSRGARALKAKGRSSSKKPMRAARRTKRGSGRAARSKRNSVRGRLMNPLAKVPARLKQKHYVNMHQSNVDTLTDVNGCTRGGIKYTFVLNDFNTPWSGFCVAGQQPWGHDQYQLHYRSVKVLSVKVRITLRRRKVNSTSSNGLFYMRLKDTNTAEDWSAHGVACENILTGGTTQGAGYQQYIQDSPRYKTKRLYNNLDGGTVGQTPSLSVTWRPSKTHLLYTKEDFSQTMNAINMSLPPKTAHLHWGFIQDNITATNDVFDVYIHKTYQVEYGNPIARDVS